MDYISFKNKEEYLKYAKHINEFPNIEMGKPFIFKKINSLLKFYRSPFNISKKWCLKRVIKLFAKENDVPLPKIIFTRDENIKSACFKTKSNVIMFQVELLKTEFWYCFTLLVHELSHCLIYSNIEIHKSIMSLSNEVKSSIEHNEENNIILPEELYANGVMTYLLTNCHDKTKEYEDSLFNAFKKEISII